MKNVSIKSWSSMDRPREKLILNGKNALSDAELMAILLGSGSKEESALALSKRILHTVGNNLNNLAKLPISQLMKFKGIGKVKAITIITALEFGKRKQYESEIAVSRISCSKDVFNAFHSHIATIEHEEFWVMYLNNSNVVLSKQQISKGGITATLVDVRLVLKKALELSAIGIILCHNHPSGIVKPSHADRNLTEKIRTAATTMDIALLDHLIITEKAYFSFADEGLL
ncbi:DNA repair protein RadC [Tenacibaculum sp. SG-28]|uniref:RadC family protein n=1 Tax=Tenacibaculum sp. SG-28 TaxID=754426 RepID=UPI000CF57F52|nr:DNA repair protein RadC [Tenacibaculum sp. SG-28]PQJ22974.1 hypothetical protein BSU00_01475 [Tenacibaculum sp. SG-28]